MIVALTGITVLASGNGYSQVNTCGTSVAAGGTCTITVTFKPTAAGASSGSVTVSDSAPNSPQTITLTGTGELPVSVSPAALAFGTVKVGTSSAAKVVTLINNMKTGLTITNMTFIGTAAADYSQTQSCGSILNGLSKCTINVTFKPSVKGSRPATFEVIDSATNSPQKVTLSGAGRLGALAERFSPGGESSRAGVPAPQCPRHTAFRDSRLGCPFFIFDERYNSALCGENSRKFRWSAWAPSSSRMSVCCW